METKTLGYIGLVNAILAFAVQAPMGFNLAQSLQIPSLFALIFYLAAGAILALGAILVITNKNVKIGGVLLIAGGIITLMFGLIGIIVGILILRQPKAVSHKKKK